MKIGLLITSAFSLIGGFSLTNANYVETLATISTPSGTQSGPSLTTTIDLNDSSETEIREYYSLLSSFAETQRSGKNFLSALKIVLSDMYYYTYTNIWAIHEITDRDWDLSPASEITTGTYDEEANTITGYSYGSSYNNPYAHALYRNKDDATGLITIYGDHNQTGLNREHVWPQSRGFQTKTSNGAEGPAGTDLHHLKIADGRVNQQFHNNYPYGNVDTAKSYQDASSYRSYVAGNLLGTSAYDGSSQVFEPHDDEKGDIARSVFYMAARYNNWFGETGVITDYEPFLEITDTAYTDTSGSVTSSDSKSATMGILHDLLEWHEQDPVDEYEIHRNNLIYHNYQGNRNPFIDFPEWVTYIWGTSEDMTPQGIANPSSDTINGYNEYIFLDQEELLISVGEEAAITITNPKETIYTWSVDNADIVSIAPNGSSVTVTGLEEGEANVTVTNSNSISASCYVKVTAKTEELHNYQKLSYSDTLSSGTYILGAETSENSFLISTPMDIIEDKVTGESNTLGYVSNAFVPFYYIEISFNDKKVTISDGTNYLGIGDTTSLVLSSSPYEWTLEEGINGTFRLSSEDDRALLYRENLLAFGNYATSNVTSGGQYHDLEIYASFDADDYYSYFLEATASFDNLSEEEIKEIWASILASYVNLSNYDKEVIANASESDETAQEVKERYKNIVNQYTYLDDYLDERTVDPEPSSSEESSSESSESSEQTSESSSSESSESSSSSSSESSSSIDSGSSSSDGDSSSAGNFDPMYILYIAIAIVIITFTPLTVVTLVRRKNRHGKKRKNRR